MATQTTYYEFNKPQGTDLVNPLVDTNPNWDIADSALHELNERSVANCTEVVSLGVHALSTLNTDTKFLKWIATANFTAGDTYTLNGTGVAAATPSGGALATDSIVSGAVVLACLNADNSALTIYVTGTNVADDSNRLGGELPSYYATEADMSDAQTDITNIQNLEGNTSIVGIGDGTLTGAVSAIHETLSTINLGYLGSPATWSANDIGSVMAVALAGIDVESSFLGNITYSGRHAVNGFAYKVGGNLYFTATINFTGNLYTITGIAGTYTLLQYTHY